MGRKITHEFSKVEDSYLKDNYLLITRKEISEHLKLSHNVIKRRMDELGLVMPIEVVNRFKGTHKSFKDQKPKPEKKVKAKKSETSNRRGKVEKPEETKFKSKQVDYSKLEMYRVDNKTWKYRPKKSA